ncbi:Hypothetical_protein [Hexamita inflata]|uniref:Hypothetical_protein n=1 Tax=Hexamita inflata TaxID=28002 RepID=A0AA86R8R7_9EUKA|nr:Hypothetical protein HINF_LOCUS61176 [Hexamita inflata]
MNVSVAALLQSKDLTVQLLQFELQNAISEKISVRALLDQQIIVNSALNDDLENLYNQFAQMQVSQVQTQNNESNKIIETFQMEQQILQDRLTVVSEPTLILTNVYVIIALENQITVFMLIITYSINSAVHFFFTSSFK